MTLGGNDRRETPSRRELEQLVGENPDRRLLAIREEYGVAGDTARRWLCEVDLYDPTREHCGQGSDHGQTLLEMEPDDWPDEPIDTADSTEGRT